MGLVHNNKYKIYHMRHKQSQKPSMSIMHFIQIIFQGKPHGCWASTNAQLILHELIPQIPLFWNYQKFIHAY